MLKDQCISVTDLRTKTKQCLEQIDAAPKYIFSNNHPIAVLLSISDFEENFTSPHLMELPAKDVDPHTALQAKKARRSQKSGLINIR